MEKSKKMILILPTALTLLSLASCNIYSIVPLSSSSSSEAPEISKVYVSDGVYRSENFLQTTLQDVSYQRGMDLPPSTGDVNVLVLPIEFSDYAFSEDTLNNVSLTLSGTNTGYWESVASFYEKSSYGKLHLNFHMAPIYETGITARNAAKNDYIYELNDEKDKYSGQYYVNKAVEAYDDSTAPLTDFDQDDDGIIDAVIAVYSCPNYMNKTYSFSYSGQVHKDESLFWGYTYWCLNYGDLSSPKANTYIWLSYDFFEKGGKADPHTLIHEYGHVMGLDDYYSTEVTFQPAGGIDMMDMNVTDHDAYTKCALGWTSPYIIDGDDVTITIKPSESSGDCLLIPTSSFNGTLWDEYILLELYTPDGLNELDSTTAYNGTYPQGYTIPGIKIYHIDSRLIQCNYSSKTESYTSTPYVKNPNSIDLDSDDVCYLVGATNCSKKFNSSMVLSSNREYSSDYSLIHLIEASGTNTFSKGKTGTNATLFQAGSSFSLGKYGNSFFQNRSYMNNGDSFPYTIAVESVSSSGATIRITKNSN